MRKTTVENPIQNKTNDVDNSTPITVGNKTIRRQRGRPRKVKVSSKNTNENGTGALTDSELYNREEENEAEHEWRVGRTVGMYSQNDTGVVKALRRSHRRSSIRN